MMGILDMASGAAAGGFWKAGVIVLAGLLLVVATGGGTGWWLAAHDRDTARADLVAEQRVSAELRASIALQNSAVDAMQTATVQADARGLAAQQQAAASGRRYDAALAKLVSVRATTCADAMPAVNQLLRDVK